MIARLLKRFKTYRQEQEFDRGRAIGMQFLDHIASANDPYAIREYRAYWVMNELDAVDLRAKNKDTSFCDGFKFALLSNMDLYLRIDLTNRLLAADEPNEENDKTEQKGGGRQAAERRGGSPWPVGEAHRLLRGRGPRLA
jgi:hypothetical protein